MHYVVHVLEWIKEGGPWAIVGAVGSVVLAYFLITPMIPTRCRGFGDLEGIWGVVGFSCGLYGNVTVGAPERLGLVAAVLLGAGAIVGRAVGVGLTGKTE